MKPKDAAPRDPEMFKKSTNLGMNIAAIVTTSITTTRSTYTLILCTNLDSVLLWKNSVPSIISKAQSIYMGYDVRAFMQNSI